MLKYFANVSGICFGNTDSSIHDFLISALNGNARLISFSSELWTTDSGEVILAEGKKKYTIYAKISVLSDSDEKVAEKINSVFEQIPQFTRKLTGIEVWGWNGVGYEVDEYGNRVLPPEPPQKEETEEEKRARLLTDLENEVNRMLDEKSREYGYESILVVCSYLDSGNEKYDKEGSAFRVWRSAIWEKFYQLIEGVEELPAFSEIVGELPEFVMG